MRRWVGVLAILASLAGVAAAEEPAPDEDVPRDLTFGQRTALLKRYHQERQAEEKGASEARRAAFDAARKARDEARRAAKKALGDSLKQSAAELRNAVASARRDLANARI